MKILDKLICYGLYLFVFLLPWQTRWIFKEASLNSVEWEYGRLSLYGSEILLIILLILAVVKWLLYYQKLNQQQRAKEIKSEFSGLKLWLILLALWSAITIIWSKDSLLSWYGWLKLMEGIALFWLISSRIFLINKKIIGFSLIFSAVIQSLIGIGQWILQYSLSSKWLGMSYLNPAALGISVIETASGRFLRAYGSFPHPNMLAGFLVISILIAFILINREKSSTKTKWFYFALIVMSGGLFLTFSRAGWLALFISLAVYLLFYYSKKINRQKLIQPAFLIILIFIFLSLANFDLIKSRLQGQERLEVRSNIERLNSYKQALPIIKEYWYKGVGLGHYTLALHQKNPVLESWDYQPVHDAALLSLAELGIIGLLLFILIIISAFRYRSKYTILLLVILILGCFDHYFRSFYVGIILWWLIISLNSKVSGNL
ncbi:O-antigen ligase family protein [Patescibacteria group bacterium]|nr:O-antigen ligase family protein [Patescibacteria group bacterium]